MPRAKLSRENASYYKFKVLFDDERDDKYFVSSKEIIKYFNTNGVKITPRIIFRYTNTNSPDFVPKNRRRVKRGFWIEKCRKYIIRNNEDYICV